MPQDPAPRLTPIQPANHNAAEDTVGRVQPLLAATQPLDAGRTPAAAASGFDFEPLAAGQTNPGQKKRCGWVVDWWASSQITRGHNRELEKKPPR
jgi:hypothetical protein